MLSTRIETATEPDVFMNTAAEPDVFMKTAAEPDIFIDNDDPLSKF